MTQQQKAWYKHGWGLAAAILLFPFFIIWYAWQRSKWSKEVKIGVTVAVGILVLIGVVVNGSKTDQASTTTAKTTTPSTSQHSEQTTQSVAPAQEKPKKDTSLLNATVKKAYDVPGVEITNNESVNWDNCQLTLNSSYKRTIRNPLEPNSPLNNPYGLFTKSDGTKFDPEALSVKDLYVSCSVNGTSRNNYFVF